MLIGYENSTEEITPGYLQESSLAEPAALEGQRVGGVSFLRSGRGRRRTNHDHTQNWRGRPLAARKDCGRGRVDGHQPEPAYLLRTSGELLGGLPVRHGKI